MLAQEIPARVQLGYRHSGQGWSTEHIFSRAAVGGAVISALPSAQATSCFTPAPWQPEKFFPVIVQTCDVSEYV